MGKATAAKGTSGLVVVYQPTSELIPYARNSRTHNDAQVAQIAASIREFGFTNPILVDPDNGIVAGHGRVLAAHLLKLPEVPTITLHGLTDAQRRAYIIADNKLALNAGWDNDMLLMELGELNDEGYDLALTGFTKDDLTRMLDAAPPPLADGAPSDDPLDVDLADTMLTLGPYRIPVKRDKFLQWQEAVRSFVGFDNAAVEAEILKRLDLD